jgi:hypothetical protein
LDRQTGTPGYAGANAQAHKRGKIGGAMKIEYVCPWEVEVKWHKPDEVTCVISASGKTREDAFDQVRKIMDGPSISINEAARRAGLIITGAQ